MSGMLGRLFGRVPEADGDLDYDRAREIARHPDAGVRRRLAKRADVRPELLYYLSDDPAPEVRREIAANEATPPHAYKGLAQDADEDVRCDLALKIARLTPGLTNGERDKIHELTLEALEILACDQMVRARQVIAETLKNVANVPRHIIQRLARDSVLAVAAPVLEFSPLLTDDDLIEIIESSAVVGALSAISRRGGISETVSDAIADSNDQDAVAALLANSSAQIREETLDQLVDGARRVERWQMPIALRPRLPLKAARKLAGFVADAVLGALMRRDDLDEETTALVSKTVHQRMREGLAGDGRDRDGDLGTRPDQPKADKPKRVADEVRSLHKEGKLDDARIDAELTSGNRAFVTHALAIKSGLMSSVIGRIAAARSAKGVTALAWKAGFSMRFAIKLQARFGNVPPGEILQARDGFDFPMSEEDMNWQLDFYAS